MNEDGAHSGQPESRVDTGRGDQCDKRDKQ